MSRNRRHWKEKTTEGVRIGENTIKYNRGATRWLGIWIDSRLSFREHADRNARKARKAEARLTSLMRRNGVPPLSARHLQEAIVGSTLMYGTEVTWRGQRFTQDSIQKAINRMSRASLGVLPTTPVAFLESVGGSMPAGPRLQLRQASYAARVMSSETEEIRDIARGGGDLAARLRTSVQGDNDQGPIGRVTMIERTSPPRGRRFPGQICIPTTTPGEEAKKERMDRAIAHAKGFTADSRTFWTDGSALAGGVGAGAVVGFMESRKGTGSEGQTVLRERKGIIRSGQRIEKEDRKKKVQRPVQDIRQSGWWGWTESRGMESGGRSNGLRCGVCCAGAGGRVVLPPGLTGGRVQYLHGLAGGNGQTAGRQAGPGTAESIQRHYVCERGISKGSEHHS